MANDIIDIIVTDNSDNVQLNVTPNLVSINVSNTSGNIIGSNYYLASTYAALPVTGDTTTLYIINDTSLMYRWNGTAYTQINSSAVVSWGQITGTLSGQTDLQTALNLKANLASPTFTGTVAGITKGMVGLSNVDNTTDVGKPISTLTQTALDAKASNTDLALKAPLASPAFTGTVTGITKSMVGLPNADNTSDVNKPVSTANQTALDLKANLASPTFTGTVGGITKSMVGLGSVDNTTDLLKPISTATQSALDLKYNATNPAGYTTNTGTVTSVAGTGTVSGLTLTGTVTTNGSLTLGGTLALTSGNVTSALTFTPYNATNPSGYISSITSGNVTTALGYTPENLANKGIAGGYASLDGGGLIPSTQLPSYVDDVLEYANLASFPATGTTGKIYTALDTNNIYRWSGSVYIEVSPTVGTIWGGIVGTLANQTDLQNALNLKATLASPTFTGTVSGITKSMVSLGNVDNTSDANKPVSTATQTALDLKYNASNPSGYTNNTGTVTSVALTTPAAFTVTGSPITTTGTLAITAAGTSAQYITGAGALATLNTANTPELTNLYYTDARARAAHSLTVTGSSGASTYSNSTGVLNVPTYTLSGLGGQSLATNLTSLSGLTYVSASFVKMSAAGTFSLDTSVYLTSITSGNVTTALGFTPYNATNPSGYTSNVGTVTSVAALTLGTTGTDLSSSVATGTVTPVITLNVPNASASNRGALLAADWSTFNSKQGAITLTTTGTSGAATFSANTLNIPNYGSALSGYLPLTGGTLTGALTGTSATFSGNVGIGTISPSEQLNVMAANAYTSKIRFSYGSSATSYYTNFGYNSDGNKAYLQIADGGAAGTIMTWNYNGNVGIGTTSPSYLLDVNGTGRFSGALTSSTIGLTGTGGAIFTSSATTTSAVYGYINNTSGRFYWGSESSTGGSITTGSTAYYGQIAAQGLQLSANTGSNVHVTITPAGNVIFTAPIRLKGYTVSTLPAGTQGDAAFVTDALAPTFMSVLVGGGSIVSRCLYNGTNWTAQ